MLVGVLVTSKSYNYIINQPCSLNPEVAEKATEKYMKAASKHNKTILYKIDSLHFIITFRMFTNFLSREFASIIAVFIFIILFGIINALRPSIIYNKDLSFRRFGIGYKNKTVIPIWLFAIVLAILVYVGVVYLFEYKAVY